MSNSLKIVFAGTPDFAAQHLRALLYSPHQIVGVLTQPDRPAGRGNKLTASAVKIVAKENNLPVFQPTSLREAESQQIIADLNADIMIVVAYGLILPKIVLTMLPLGCINVHASLLPRWRGAAPIQRALWAGDTTTGVTIMQMDAGLDTGDILLKRPYAICDTDTSCSLFKTLAEIGAQALLETLARLVQNQLNVEKQDNALATYAKKLSKAEAQIDWRCPAAQLERHVRAFNPWPASFFYANDTLVKVWQTRALPHQEQPPGKILHTDKEGIHVATGDGVLSLEKVQLAGKRAMPVGDVLNANQTLFIPGTMLA